jgi:(E)-4-hydroxy-3-methylbut-2-enyl-diphosphate synthase
MQNKDLYQRFPTREVMVGDVPMGGKNPVRVQSMTNTDTLDVKGTVAQAIRMIEAGCEYVRIAVPFLREVESLKVIRNTLRTEGFHTPLIADVHFNAAIAEEAARIVGKVRINPGNYTSSSINKAGIRLMNDTDALGQISDRLRPLLRICKTYGTAIRIGVNHGSLSARIMEKYGDTVEGMVESAMEFVRVCEAESFHNLVFSMKASNTRVMIAANRLLVEKMKMLGMNYPIHLGVTEAGAGEDGRIRSAIGIGSLLADGIGDTIRVSLTEAPEAEIPVAYNVLQATGVRISKAEFVACPSCARTQYNIMTALENIRQRTQQLKGIKIAVMGCIVNGPGEMADAHYGYVGAGKGKITLYKGKVPVKKNLSESLAVEALVELIRESGDWVEE